MATPFLHCNRIRARAPMIGLAALLAFTVAWAEAERIEPAIPGRPFPAGTYATFEPRGETASVDLAQVLGKKPVVFCYWIPGNKRADEVLKQLADLAREVGRDKLEVYGVVAPNASIGLSADVIQAKIQALGLDLRVLRDDGFKIGKQLNVRSVPHVTIVDRSGTVRLTNGASLHQVLGYKTDLTAAIRRVAETGELLTYGFLDPYYPVKELEGRPCPDFRAALLTTSVEQHWRSLIDPQKLNVLIFWSVDCPHCRKSLPEISVWLRQHPDGLNVVSCAKIGDETTKLKTEEFCRFNDFAFPTLVDRNAEIGELYGVTTTPTIVIIGPDGVVDSAIVSTHSDFATTIEARKRALLKPTGS